MSLEACPWKVHPLLTWSFCGAALLFICHGVNGLVHTWVQRHEAKDMDWPWPFLSVAVMKQMVWDQLREGNVANLHSQDTVHHGGKMGKESKQELEEEIMENHLLTCKFIYSYFSYLSQDHLLGDNITHSGLGPASVRQPRGQSALGKPSSESAFPGDSRLFWQSKKDRNTKACWR